MAVTGLEILKYGSSIGHLPSQVNIKKTLTRHQNKNCERNLNGVGKDRLMEATGKTYRASTDNPRAITPPSFDGIDRKMAYANRKYHSG